MNKKIKRTAAIMASASMLAAAFPAISFADGSGIAVNVDSAAVTSDKDAVAIVASYDSEGRLEAVSSTAVAAGETQNVDVKTGDKVMLWNGIGEAGNQPVVNAVTVAEPEATAVPTDAPTDEPTAVPTDAPTDEPEATEEPTQAPTEAPADSPEPLYTEGPDATAKPTLAPVEGAINTWLFDFGSAEDVEDGYTAVTADVNYTLNTSGEYQYGFIGTNEKDYKLAGGRVDGFVQQEGQTIELSQGGTTGLNDAIGSTGADTYGNAGDKYYPVRFALKTGDEKYFRVRAHVTTLDPSKDATASLYTERKHPLYTEKTIKAGETEVTEFTVRTTPIYYEKSDPKGRAADEMVNVALLGENSALAALEIYELETAPVLWVVGDSTVTDGGGTLPFWPLQNYTGVGTGLTKYLPSDIAMVNEGEGGLAAGDNYHFNMIKDRIKAGDYLYMEYGHNHKTDGVEGYKTHLDKYYDACKAVGATYIIVGPIDRHNSSQYDALANTWSTTLGGFSAAGKEYVDAKIAEGATDIAFVDLNQPSLDWYTTLTEKGVVKDNEVTNDIKLTNYYFQTSKGGSTDGTHPNDAGAENLAYFFFSTADTEAYPALEPLMTRYKAGEAEEPTPVSPEVINLGYASNEAWPSYQLPGPELIPIVIKKIAPNEDGILELTAYVQASFENYASGVLEFLDEEGNVTETFVTTNHVDNTTGTGTNVLTFAEGVSIPEGQAYQAYMWSCALDEERLMTEEEGGKMLSNYYEPTDIETYLLPGEDSDIDTFDYYGKTALNGSNGWIKGGSAGINDELGTDDDGRTYTNISVSSAGNSWFVMRPFENLPGGTGSSGKYLVDVDLKYLSGANVTFEFAKSIKSSSPFASDELQLFSVNNATIKVVDDEGVESDRAINGAVLANGTYAGALAYNAWTNVKYILDMDKGIATVSVAGGEPVEVSIPMYDSILVPTIDTLANFVISGGKGASFELQMSNLTVAKLASDALPEMTLKVSSADNEMGTAEIADGGDEITAQQNTIKTIVATPLEGYDFVQWTDAEGNNVSYASSLDVRMHENLEFIAEFKAAEFDPINYAYKEQFNTLATSTLSANGWVSPNAQGSATIENDDDHGNYVKFAPGSANDRNLKATFPAAAQLSDDYVITFDMALTYGTNHASDFVVFDSSASVSNNAQVTSNYILKLNNGASYSTDWTINGGEDTVTIPAGTWVNVFMTVHPSASTVDLVIKNGDTELINKTEAINGTGILGGINILSGRYNGVSCIDNIKVYTADQIAD